MHGRTRWRPPWLRWNIVTIRKMVPFEDSNAPPPALAGVLAVDDQETFREILRRLVSLSSGLTLLGEVDSGERAVVAVKELQPDMVVMDVVRPGSR